MWDVYNNTRSEGFGEEVAKRIMLGTMFLSANYYDDFYKKAMKVRAVIKNHLDKIFNTCNAILCPTTPITAPLAGEKSDDHMKLYDADLFTAFANLAGLPGLSIPCGFDAAGLPVGAQLVGAALSDGALLNIGYAFQSATNFHKRLPEVQS